MRVVPQMVDLRWCPATAVHGCRSWKKPPYPIAKCGRTCQRTERTKRPTISHGSTDTSLHASAIDCIARQGSGGSRRPCNDRSISSPPRGRQQCNKLPMLSRRQNSTLMYTCSCHSYSPSRFRRYVRCTGECARMYMLHLCIHHM